MIGVGHPKAAEEQRRSLGASAFPPLQHESEESLVRIGV